MTELAPFPFEDDSPFEVSDLSFTNTQQFDALAPLEFSLPAQSFDDGFAASFSGSALSYQQSLPVMDPVPLLQIDQMPAYPQLPAYPSSQLPFAPMQSMQSLRSQQQLQLPQLPPVEETKSDSLLHAGQKRKRAAPGLTCKQCCESVLLRGSKC
jgi:hypothetical protein